MDEKRQRISEKAYYHWEREGRPAGREQDHWLKAEVELEREATERGRGKAQTAASSAVTGAKKTTKNKSTKRAVKKKAK